MTNQTKTSSLTIGNHLFREHDYLGAKLSYEQFVSENPQLASAVEINILLCDQAIEKPKPNHINPINTNLEVQNKIRTMLEEEINNKTQHSLPDNATILNLIKSIDKNKVNSSELESIIVCAQSSPFQRDLLWYTGRRIKESTNLDLEHLTKSSGVTLAQLILLATNPTYWILNRIRIRKQFEIEEATDARAYELTDLRPFEIDKGHEGLPPLLINKHNSYRWQKHPKSNDRNPHTVAGMSIDFGTILLNENNFIGLNILQHYHLCNSWTLVEGACQGYPKRKVSPVGLSLDNCASQIRLFPDPSNKLRFVQHGWTVCDGEAAKSEMRNRYLESCSSDLLLVIDADEFYLEKNIIQAVHVFKDKDVHAATLPQVHFWKTTDKFITGEYYDVAHTRFFRNHPGMKYVSNHNFPELGGQFIHKLGTYKFPRTIKKTIDEKYEYLEPSCFHMGFAKDHEDMRDKSDYYINRGEATTRKATTDSRAAWFDDNLPEKCLLRPWGGTIPEAIKP